MKGQKYGPCCYAFCLWHQSGMLEAASSIRLLVTRAMLYTSGVHQSCCSTYEPLPLKWSDSQLCHLQGSALRMTQHMTTCSREQMNHLRRNLLTRVPITLRSTDLMCPRFSPWWQHLIHRTTEETPGTAEM